MGDTTLDASGSGQPAAPTLASEDASHLLGKLTIFESAQPADESRENIPDGAAEWLVTATLSDPKPIFDPKVICNVFDEQFRKEFGTAFVYGRDASDGRWTCIMRHDAPRVTDLQLAWEYRPRGWDPPADPSRYASRFAEVNRRLAPLGRFDVRASLTPVEASLRERTLHALVGQLNKSAQLRITAPEGHPYDGRAVLDVVRCLGLDLNYMGNFCWRNPTNVGHEFLFEVTTSTQPCDFSLEALADGSFNPGDVIFEFSIPRSPAPLQMFDAISRAVQYAQKRLGGELGDSVADPVDVAKARAGVAEIASQLESEGFAPGSQSALRLF